MAEIRYDLIEIMFKANIENDFRDLQKREAYLKKCYSVLTTQDATIPYNNIAEYVYNNENSNEQNETLNTNIAFLFENYQGEGADKLTLKKNLEKISNNYSLSQAQKSYIGTITKGVEQQVKSTQKMVKDIKENADKVQITLENIEKTKSSFYTDFIAILGVFSSFVFVMFGGFSALSTILDSLGKTNVSLTKMVFISSVLIGFLITVLYSLIYWISLIIGKSVVFVTCDCEGVCVSKWHHFCKHRYYLCIITFCIIISFISAYLIIKGTN